MAVCGIHDLAPDGTVHLGRIELHVHRDDAIDLGNELGKDLQFLPFIGQLLVALAGGCACHQRVALQDLGDHPHELRVIGNHQKVQRSADLDPGTV